MKKKAAKKLEAAAPLFHQLAGALRVEIRTGKRAPGDYLPNEAALGKTYGVSRVTVRHALAELKAEGLIESKPRAGTRVCPGGGDRRSRLIGAITPNMFQAHYGEFLHVLEGALRPHGLDLIVHNSELSPEIEKAGLEAHLARGVDAVVLMWDKKSGTNLATLRRLVATGTPLLVVDHLEPGLEADFIVSDHRQGMKLALGHLHGIGCRTLLHIRAVVGLWGADERERAFREEAIAFGYKAEDLTTLVGNYDEATARKALETHYRAGVPFPEGVVASADMTGQAALDFFSKKGRRIPGDMHLVTFGGDPRALRDPHRLRTLNLGPGLQAQEVVKRLMARLEGDRSTTFVVTPVGFSSQAQGLS